MIRHLLIIVGIFAASMSWLIWLCRAVDPSTRYGSEVEYNSIDAGKNSMPAFFYYLTDEEQRELFEFIKENFRPTPTQD